MGLRDVWEKRKPEDGEETGGKIVAKHGEITFCPKKQLVDENERRKAQH